MPVHLTCGLPVTDKGRKGGGVRHAHVGTVLTGEQVCRAKIELRPVAAKANDIVAGVNQQAAQRIVVGCQLHGGTAWVFLGPAEAVWYVGMWLGNERSLVKASDG